MNRNKRIFIIDDDLQNRKSGYVNSLGSRYDLLFSEDDKTIYIDIKNNNVDLFIIDLNLSYFRDPITHGKMNVISVIEKIGKTKPIIILSGDYKLLLEDNKLSPSVSYFAEEGYNICSFLSWDEIMSNSHDDNPNNRETLYQKIDFAIYKDKKPYDFGIVCALKEELDPFMEKVVSKGTVYNSMGIRFQRGLIQTTGGHELSFIAAYSTNMGITDASIIATTMITKYSVPSIFMIGVCGGRASENVKIGDIIIPKSSVAYQRGKLTNDGFSSEIMSAQPKENLLNYDNTQNEEILATLFKDYVSKKVNEGTVPDLSKPRVINETIACADYVIDKEGEIDRIAKIISQRKLCGVDMESYALFRVGQIHDINTLVIKSVMDLTNKKGDEYKQYAAYMSANFLYQLLFRELITF